MASKKKGLSADEKRNRLLELFYESNTFFQMKELEKIAPRQKGIVPQSVKEVTQLLVDEGLVECEKIGTFVCYWAFPSQASVTRMRQLKELEEAISSSEIKLKEMETDITNAKKGKEATKERKNLENQIEDLQTKHNGLKQKLEKLCEEGPEAIARLQDETTKARDAANRWTDNIFAAKKWCKTKFNVDDKLLDVQFEIPPDLDYIE